MTGEDAPGRTPQGEWLGHVFDYSREAGTITFHDPARGFTSIHPMGPELFDALDALNPETPLEST